MTKNVRIINQSRILNSFVCIWPVATLIYLAKGLNYYEIGCLNAFSGAMTALLEIPLGMIADRFGRKKNLIAGFSFRLIFCATLFIARGFLALLVTEVLFVVASCFISGTDTAIMYESLKEEGKADKYTQILSKNTQVVLLVNAFIPILATQIYSKNPSLIFLVTFIFYLCNFALAFRLKEVHLQEKEIKKAREKNENENLRGNLLRHFNTYSSFYMLALLSSLIVLLSSNVSIYSIPMLNTQHIDVNKAGIVLFVANFCSFLMLKVSAKLEEKLAKHLPYAVLLVSGCICISAFWFKGPIFACAFLILLRVLFTISSPIVSSLMNKQIASKHRVTMLSVSNMMDNIFFFFFDILTGVSIENLGILYTLGLLGIFVVVLVCVILLVRKKRVVVS